MNCEQLLGQQVFKNHNNCASFSIFFKCIHHFLLLDMQLLCYRKIPKTSPGAYIFQRPHLRGLFLEGLIFGGAYLWRRICVSKSIGLALQLEVNLPFLLCLTLYLREIFEVHAPRGLYLAGRFNGAFFVLLVWGLIHGGAYFQNFTVFIHSFHFMF